MIGNLFTPLPGEAVLLTGAIPALAPGILFLISSMLCSVLIAMILKHNETRHGSRRVVIAANYIVACGYSLAQWGREGWPAVDGVTLLLGALGGAVFIGTFLLMTAAIGRVGIAIPVSVTRLAVVLPVAVSILFYREMPAVFHLAGFAAALGALALFGRAAAAGRPGSPRLSWSGVLLTAGLFLAMGAVETLLKIFHERRVPAQKYGFVAIIFGTALLLGWLLILLRRELPSRADLALGLAMGLPNVLSTVFMLGALRYLPGMVAFPVNALGIVLLSTLAGAVIWGERPDRSGRLAIALALAAIVLINLRA